MVLLDLKGGAACYCKEQITLNVSIILKIKMLMRVAYNVCGVVRWHGHNIGQGQLIPYIKGSAFEMFNHLTNARLKSFINGFSENNYSGLILRLMDSPGL